MTHEEGNSTFRLEMLKNLKFHQKLNRFFCRFNFVNSIFNQLQHSLGLDSHFCHLKQKKKREKQNNRWDLQGRIIKQLLMKKVRDQYWVGSKQRVKICQFKSRKCDQSVKRRPSGWPASALICSQWNAVNPSEKQNKKNPAGLKIKTLHVSQPVGFLWAKRESEEGKDENLDLLGASGLTGAEPICPHRVRPH